MTSSIIFSAAFFFVVYFTNPTKLYALIFALLVIAASAFYTSQTYNYQSWQMERAVYASLVATSLLSVSAFLIAKFGIKITLLPTKMEITNSVTQYSDTLIGKWKYYYVELNFKNDVKLSSIIISFKNLAVNLAEAQFPSVAMAPEGIINMSILIAVQHAGTHHVDEIIEAVDDLKRYGWRFNGTNFYTENIVEWRY